MSKRAPYESSPTTRIDAVVPPTRDVFAIGDVLNETYEIRGILGEGGMGQVYEAHDHLLNRAVAIKVAWPTVDATAVRKEARALAAIRHPCIITVYACGVHEGTEYVVMERVLGVNLETHIRRRTNAGKPFGIAEALEILATLADGLAVVHRAGIAHRDVKPDNVMLAPAGRVVLMDFGVFVPEFEANAEGSASGSPAYMAPETVAGTIGNGGGFLVDVYAFGVIAFELLTGSLPFPGATARDVLLKHLAARVPTLREHRPDAPLALDELVRELMAKDPIERPQSMEEVAHRLRRMLGAPASEPAPASARPSIPSSTGRIRVEETPAIGAGALSSDDEARTTHTRNRFR